VNALENIPGARFDRVVVGVLRRLTLKLHDAITAGTTAVVAFAAPIREAAKTVEALAPKIEAAAGRKSSGRDRHFTVLENHICLRLVRHERGRAPRVVGFAYTPGRDLVGLLVAAEGVLSRSRRPRARQSPRRPATGSSRSARRAGR